MRFIRKMILTCFVILFVIGIPICLQYFVFDNNVISNVSNDGWAGFFGCYIGALTTLIALSIQMKENERIRNAQMQYIENNRKKEEILNIRPYLYINVISWVTDGAQIKISGEIRNIGLHSACDIWIYENDMDHPDSNQSWTQHLSICANGGEKIERNFDFNKTLFYKFSFYDLKSNRYEQEFRFDTSNKKFYSLEPHITRYAD